jgi:hypothetical protein
MHREAFAKNLPSTTVAPQLLARVHDLDMGRASDRAGAVMSWSEVAGANLFHGSQRLVRRADCTLSSTRCAVGMACTRFRRHRHHPGAQRARQDRIKNAKGLVPSNARCF